MNERNETQRLVPGQQPIGELSVSDNAGTHRSSTAKLTRNIKKDANVREPTKLLRRGVSEAAARL